MLVILVPSMGELPAEAALLLGEEEATLVADQVAQTSMLVLHKHLHQLVCLNLVMLIDESIW